MQAKNTMNAPNEPIIITTTGDHMDVLETIAAQLIERRFAACVQISSPIVSYYRWKGRVECCNEWGLVIKTSRTMYPQVQQLILDLHNYDQPQIVAVSITDGSQSYLNWLVDQLDDGTVE